MRTIRVLAIGDSLTAGWGVAEDAAFPVILQKELRAEGRRVEIVDAGVSGDTTSGARTRMDWVLRDRFDAAIVELGANDSLRGMDPERVFVNLDLILNRLEARKVPILLAGMLAPPNLGAEYAASFNEVYRRLAHSHDVVFYPFFLEGVAADPALNQGDGIHPNAEGVQVIVKRILPYVHALLDRVPAAGGAELVGGH